MSINAIKVNLQRTANKLNQTNIQKDVKKEEKNTTQTPQQQKTVSAEDVFKYMSATNPISVKKSLDVNAYIDSSSVERIKDSMKEFEKQFSTKLASVKSEFGNISDDLAQKITLSMF